MEQAAIGYNMHLFLAFFLIRLALAIWPISPSTQQQPLLGPHPAPTHGALASANRGCSQIGIDLLRAGGNAADALVGTVFCIGVLDCHHSGIGGGGFALARSPKGHHYESIDFRETAPAAADVDMFHHNIQGSLFGGLASGVPGEVRGLEYIHRKYGRLEWKTVMAPAIELAREGFMVSADFATAMDLYTKYTGVDPFSADPVWAVDFAPNGTRVGKGDVMTRKRYADTLEAIADQGADALYHGRMAEEMVKAVRKSNGSMTVEDLEAYRVRSRQPVKIDYKGYQIYGCGVPASSAVTLSALKILENYDDYQDKELMNLGMHHMTEAMRFGYGKRASLGDPDYVDGMHDFELEMLSEDFANATRHKISDRHTLNVSAYDPQGFEIKEDHGTSHVVTADASGLALSLTTTVNLFFGSRVMVPETGVIMNDEMNDFSIPNIPNAFGYYPSPANYVKPRKRSLSSISPIIITHPNNTLYVVLGASGGSKIITATLQNALHILEGGMDLKAALKQPRLHDQLIPNVAVFEQTFEKEIVDFMKGRMHNVTWAATAGSSAQAIRILDGQWEAEGEPRQVDSMGLVT